MALGKQRNRVSVKGGGFLKIRQIAPTPSDPWLDVGYVQDTQLDDTHALITAKDERGFIIDFVSGGEEPVIKVTLQQASIDEINLLKLADGLYYEVYYSCKLANGNFQEYDFPCCKIKPGPVLAFKSATERTLALEIHALAIIATTTFVRAPTTFNIDPTVNLFYVVTENASQQNPPSDTASAVKTAVF